jgi:hypothetical protein
VMDSQMMNERGSWAFVHALNRRQRFSRYPFWQDLLALASNDVPMHIFLLRASLRSSDPAGHTCLCANGTSDSHEFGSEA